MVFLIHCTCRQWALTEFQLWEGELDYIGKLMNVCCYLLFDDTILFSLFSQCDLRNNSAWNQVRQCDTMTCIFSKHHFLLTKQRNDC